MSIQYKNRTFRLVLTRGHDTSHTDRTQRDRKNKYENKNHKVGRDEEVREVEIPRTARARCWACRQSRAALLRAGTGEHRGRHAGPAQRIGRRSAPVALQDDAGRSGWTGHVLSLLPARTSGQES